MTLRDITLAYCPISISDPSVERKRKWWLFFDTWVQHCCRDPHFRKGGINSTTIFFAAMITPFKKSYVYSLSCWNVMYTCIVWKTPSSLLPLPSLPTPNTTHPHPRPPHAARFRWMYPLPHAMMSSQQCQQFKTHATLTIYSLAMWIQPLMRRTCLQVTDAFAR